MQIDKEFLLALVEMLSLRFSSFDRIQHTEGVDIYRGGCCWCGGVLVGLVDVEDIVVLPS